MPDHGLNEAFFLISEKCKDSSVKELEAGRLSRGDAEIAEVISGSCGPANYHPITNGAR